MTEQQMEIVKAAEKDADDYGVDALTTCAWAIERAEKSERQCRGLVTRRQNAAAEARKGVERLKRWDSAPRLIRSREGDVLIADGRVTIAIAALADAAHVLADTKVALNFIAGAVPA